MPIITIVILVYSRSNKSRENKTRQNKVRQEKTRLDEIYIDPLHIMKMTTTMTIIIQ